MRFTFLKQSPCLSFNSTAESSSPMSSGEEELTVFHAKYPARTAEKNTNRNLKGHILKQGKKKRLGFDYQCDEKERNGESRVFVKGRKRERDLKGERLRRHVSLSLSLSLSAIKRKRVSDLFSNERIRIGIF